LCHRFLKINRAFEVLKDDEQRRKYDTHGEKGLDGSQGNNNGGRYENWNYYNVSRARGG
jgi:DnaJ family protein C protein 10